MARNPAFEIVWEDEPSGEAAEEETPPPPPAPVVDRAPKSPKATLVWEDDDEVVEAEAPTASDDGVVVLPSLAPEYWRAVLRIRTEFNRPVTRCKAPNTTARITDDWAERSSTAERLQALQEWRDVMGWGHVG